MTSRYIDYIRDLVYLLREEGAKAAAQTDQTGHVFDEGREFAFREVLSWMKNQAETFGFPLEELCLEGFDPLNDPLDPPQPNRRDV